MLREPALLLCPVVRPAQVWLSPPRLHLPRSFLVKTVGKEEMRLLLKLIPRYYRHVAANPATLLVRFYGVHRLSPLLGRRVRRCCTALCRTPGKRLCCCSCCLPFHITHPRIPAFPPAARGLLRLLSVPPTTTPTPPHPHPHPTHTHSPTHPPHPTHARTHSAHPCCPRCASS
jgi:hypothetical protein